MLALRIMLCRRIFSSWTVAVGLGLSPAAIDFGQAYAAEVVIRPAAYSRSGNECRGSTQPVRIELRDNPSDDIQVGFFESSSGAIGEQMNASGWLSALVATQVTGLDIADYKISFSWSGLVDGPSAGGLMTSGLIAALRKDGFPTDVSMTGTINPDGTIGPVGGIAHKIEGAAAAGIARFAIPRGSRRATNSCTGKAEDLVELGDGLGVEVVEVGDIFEAYAFLTGTVVPRPAPVAFEPDLSHQVREDLLTSQRVMSDRFDAARQLVARARSTDFPPEMRALWADGEALLAASQADRKSGHQPAAFHRAWHAVLNAEFVVDAVYAMSALNARGFPGLHANVDARLAASEQHLGKRLAELRTHTVVSLVDIAAMLSIGNHLAVARAALDQGRWELAESRRLLKHATPSDFEEIGRLSFEALGHAALARLLGDLALSDSGWIGQDTHAWPRDATPINSELRLYAAAARSNLRYVDSLHTTYVAKANKADLGSAQASMKRADPIYLAATGALDVHGQFFDVYDDDFTAASAAMGALMGSVASASVLVAKYYSIGVETDTLGRVTELLDAPALDRMADLAEASASAAIGEAATATDGRVLPVLLVALDIGQRLRETAVTKDERLTAVGHLRGTAIVARFLTKLARAGL